ncbi:MAG: hypothetical protein AAGC55_02420 [Myxococcota bacterium]
MKSTALPIALLVTGLPLAIVAQLSAGCDSLSCGDGTIERDGTCEPADNSKDPNAVCGPGTTFDPATQTCESTFEPVVCDEGSTVPVTDPVTGVTTCVGTGSGSCATPLVCPTPDPGEVSICGQIFDLETKTPITTDSDSTDVCSDPGAGGPCALFLAVFDAFAFANNPSSPPLEAEVTVDECGRFRAVGIEAPTMGAIGIGGDDLPDSGNDIYTLSAAAALVVGGQTINGLRVFLARNETDAAWTESAGRPAVLGGLTFGQKGSYVPLYSYGAQPIAGVSVTASDLGGTPMPTERANTFYFADQGDSLTTVDTALETTGPNGAGLLVNSPLGSHSGSGSEISDCTWPIRAGAAPPGVIFVQEMPLLSADQSEPCL